MIKDKKHQRGAALIIAVLLVSIISFVVVTISRNALQTLIAGTNITDWEIASQAAETGLENCVLIGFGSGVWPTGATLNSDIFIRRDMDDLISPLTEISLTAPPSNPTHQYWNCKIWQQTADQAPVLSPSHYHRWPPDVTVIHNAELYGGFDADMTTGIPPLYDDVDKQQNKYSIRIFFEPELSGDYDVTLQYWLWADDNSGVTVDPFFHCPMIDYTCLQPREFTHKVGDPGGFFNQENDFDKLVSVADPTTALQYKYLHFYYNMIITAYSETTIDKLTYSTNFARCVSDICYTFGDDYYYVDAVGMYGITRTKIEATFDSYTRRYWRIPFY